MSSAAAPRPAPSPSSSSVATPAGAASAAMTETTSSSATSSSRGTAGASSPPAPSTASSVISAPTWWPPFGGRTAAPATVTPSGAMATMIAPRGGSRGGRGGPGAPNSRQYTEPSGAVGAGGASGGMPRRQLNPTLPSLRQNSTNNTENSNNNNNRSSRDGGGGDRSNVAEARAALEASMANILDRELVPRAQALHAGERVITRQQADVARATASLRQTNQQLARVVEDTSWKLRELGHLQNWTEMMERRFLTVEETLRLVRRGGDGDGSDGEKESCSSCRCSECCSDCGRSSWDGSDAGGERASGSADDGPGVDGRRDASMGEAGESSAAGCFCPDTVSAGAPASGQAGPSSSGAVSEPSTHAIKEAGVLPLVQASMPVSACQAPSLNDDPRASSPSANILDVDPSQVPLPAETDSLFEHDSMATAERPV